MENVFNKKAVSSGTRLYLKDGKKSFIKDDKYFISSNIPLIKDFYTLCGSSDTKFTSYIIVSSNYVTLYGSMVSGRTIVDVSSIPGAKYIMLCGLERDMDDLMLIDESVSYNPAYREYGGTVSSGVSVPGMVFVASNFQYNSKDRIYKISGLNSGLISGYADLPASFLVYVTFRTKISALSYVQIYENVFELCYADGTPVEDSIDTASNVIALLFDKHEKKVMLPYSSVISVLPDESGDSLILKVH